MQTDGDGGGGGITVGDQSMIDAALGIIFVTDAAAKKSVKGMDDSVDFGDATLRASVGSFCDKADAMMAGLVGNSGSLAFTMKSAAEGFTHLDLATASGLWRPMAEPAGGSGAP